MSNLSVNQIAVITDVITDYIKIKIFFAELEYITYTINLKA